jgi:hypothetical protein
VRGHRRGHLGARPEAGGAVLVALLEPGHLNQRQLVRGLRHDLHLLGIVAGLQLRIEPGKPAVLALAAVARDLHDRGQQIADTGAGELAYELPPQPCLEMEQAVWAHQKIALQQRVRGDVEVQDGPTGGDPVQLVRLDDPGRNVRAHIRHAVAIDLLHPRPVPAAGQRRTS